MTRETDRTHVRVYPPNRNGEHPIKVGIRPLGEGHEVAEGEDASEKSGLNSTSDEAIDDCVGLPEPGARPSQDYAEGA